MAADVSALEYNEYRIILIHPASRALLMVNSCGGYTRFPRVQLRMHTRVTQRLHQTLEAEWNVRGIVLDYLPRENGSSCCAVLEALPRTVSRALRPVDLQEVTDDLSENERASLLALLYEQPSTSLSRIGWIYEAVEWVETITGERISSISEIEQLNATSEFSLLRLPMRSGRTYWLKATGDPNSHEVSITSCLSNLCPDHIPAVLAVRPEWNAWLMPERRSIHLQSLTHSKKRLQLIGSAVTAIAKIQSQTVGHEKALLAAGAFDQRIPVLRGDSQLLFERIEEAMQLQVATRVPRIEGVRLRELRCIFDATCDFLEALDIPTTVLHGDMNFGNVLCAEDSCHFIDWSESYIGHPLITLQHLLLLNEPGEVSLDSTSNQQLIDRYRAVMSHVCDEDELNRALICMPFIAAASTLYGRGAWLRGRLTDIPQRQARIRTLARYMERAAREPALLETIFKRYAACSQ